MKILVVGAVAGGASFAARARRLSEHAEIILFERGEEPSFANCGLPYYIGGMIEERKKLLVAPKSLLEKRFRLDVRTRSNVEFIDLERKLIRVKPLDGGEVYEEHFDKLILSPGAHPVRPNLPGVDSPNIMTLRDLSDADKIHARTRGARSCVILGGGFIGVEMAENMVHRGIHTTLVQRDPQLMSPFDAEMTTPMQTALTSHGVQVMLGKSACRFEQKGAGVVVHLESGEAIEADFVVMSIGVMPENQLAISAGLNVGPRGGIVVNRQMQTSHPDVYAVGDVVETIHFPSGQPTQVPLAGPANRQGRIAADHVFSRSTEYRGTQGTAIVGGFGVTLAMTGDSEKVLKRNKMAYEKVYLHPAHHAGYYPGAQGMSLKLLFSPQDGRILGAQGVGGEGVDKRIDVIAMAIQGRMSVYDLEQAELCYAPQYGSAKDPVNMAGFLASNFLRGDQPLIHVEELDKLEHAIVLDVRTQSEYDEGHIPGAVHLPVDELRDRLSELPKDKPIVAYCKVGQRGYLATRLLSQHGFDVRNLSGGYTTYRLHARPV